MSTPPIRRVDVQWNKAADHRERYLDPPKRSFNGHSGQRLIAWLVIVLLFAGASLALYDLYMLVAGVGH